MQIKTFTIPVIGDENKIIENELNLFLRSHRILNLSKHLVTNSDNSMWCFCIEYIEGAKPIVLKESSSSKVDYKDVLSEEEFSRFRILRECRKTLANELAVPAYAIFIDAQLAELSKIEIDKITADNLKAINGFGEKKFEKFGHRFLELLKDETSRKSISQNS